MNTNLVWIDVCLSVVLAVLGSCCSAKKWQSSAAWRYLCSAGASVNLKNGKQTNHKQYESQNLEKKRDENTKKTTTFAHLVIIVILFELNVKWYYS